MIYYTTFSFNNLCNILTFYSYITYPSTCNKYSFPTLVSTKIHLIAWSKIISSCWRSKITISFRDRLEECMYYTLYYSYKYYPKLWFSFILQYIDWVVWRTFMILTFNCTALSYFYYRNLCNWYSQSIFHYYYY